MFFRRFLLFKSISSTKNQQRVVLYIQMNESSGENMEDMLLHKEKDGTYTITESYDIRPVTEGDRQTLELAMSEAASDGTKTKLVCRIAAMQEGVTRNKTLYPAEELERSVTTWTDPYPCPVIKDHNEWEIDNVVGRISQAYVAPDGGAQALWFEVSIIDPTAQEKVASGLWSQVSIGTSVQSATCSVCGNDWAKGTWCDHRRGKSYLKDEDDPSSKTECYWIMGGITGREVSFVTTPSAPKAGVRSASVQKASESELAAVTDMALLAFGEEDEKAMQLVESAVISHGSPAGNSESNSPTEKEEGVQKEGTTPDEDLESKQETSEDLEGEENTENSEESTDQADGSESTETDEENGDASEGSEGDESEEESEEKADPDLTDSQEESSDDDEGKTESEEDAERSELVSENARLQAEVLKLKVELYVECGLNDGILSGERESLVEMHTTMNEASLDDLIGVLHQRRGTVGNTSEQVKGSVKNDKALAIDDDKNADERHSKDVTVSVKTEKGRHQVVLVEDDGPVTIVPKL